LHGAKNLTRVVERETRDREKEKRTKRHFEGGAERGKKSTKGVSD